MRLKMSRPRLSVPKTWPRLPFSDQAGGFFHDFLQVDIFHFGVAGPRELKQIFNDFTGTVGLVHGLLVKLLTLPGIHLFAVFDQRLQGQRQIVDRIVDLMGDACGQGADGDDFAGLNQLLLALFKFGHHAVDGRYQMVDFVLVVPVRGDSLKSALGDGFGFAGDAGQRSDDFLTDEKNDETQQDHEKQQADQRQWNHMLQQAVDGVGFKAGRGRVRRSPAVPGFGRPGPGQVVGLLYGVKPGAGQQPAG